MTKNILILSAGRRVELVNIFKEEVKKIRNINVFLSDSKPQYSAACRLNKKIIKLPNCENKNYIQILMKKALLNNIKLILPTIDPELTILSKFKDTFKKYEINIIISDHYFIKDCNNKILTKKIFSFLKIKYPKIYEKNEIKYPCINKPISGSGSKNITILKNSKDLSEKMLRNKKNFFSKFISGYTEFTVDMYFDKKSFLKNIIARERLDVRNGEVIKSITNLRISNFLRKKFSKINGVIGPITIQLLIHTKKLDIYGIEINPRLGGGVTLSYKAGYNFPKNIVNEYILEKNIKDNSMHKDKLLLLRYDRDFITQ